MPFHRRVFRWRSVHNDEGYDVEFAGVFGRGRKVKYADNRGQVTVVGEPTISGSKGKWRLHFALGDKYLQRWDEGREMSPEEREAIRFRIHASLDFMGIPHTIDLA